MAVPASLHSITTYVLLEQERWFERELEFLLRWLSSGMHVVDIGAHVGVYSLPIARKIGTEGRVFAFEPCATSRKHLESGRIENGLTNLEVSPCAMSDSEKDGWLQFAEYAEANSLSQSGLPLGAGEPVSVTTLDVQLRQGKWPSIDFVKIDAEGEEARILSGGKDFLGHHSPLVMFEIQDKAGPRNALLRGLFGSLGYDTYRLLGDASCLVPVEIDETLDSLEVNLFAAKPDRAAALEGNGFCAFASSKAELADDERDKAVDCMLSMPFARSFEFSRDDILECPFREALVAYAAYRFVRLPPSRRFGALKAAYACMESQLHHNPTPPVVATFVRVALDLGRRTAARDVLRPMVTELLEQGHDASLGVLDQPFFPACERYESLPIAGRESEWFAASMIEQLELSHCHSSCYSGDPLIRLQWLSESGFDSAEMSRRLILSYARRNAGPGDLSTYLKKSHCHHNALYWSAGGLQRVSDLLQRR